MFCCCVMDTFSRKIVGWSIDTVQDSNLVVNALDMALKNQKPAPGGAVHADRGAQFTSWAFTNKIREAGLMPSFGSIGDGFDNAMMESFWSSMQIELLDRQRWSTRVELANAMFEVHRGVPQPATPSLRARVSHPDRGRGSLREDTRSSLILDTVVGNQTVGQVRATQQTPAGRLSRAQASASQARAGRIHGWDFEPAWTLAVRAFVATWASSPTGDERTTMPRVLASEAQRSGPDRLRSWRPADGRRRSRRELAHGAAVAGQPASAPPGALTLVGCAGGAPGGHEDDSR